MEKGKPQAQKASAIPPLLTRDCISQPQSQQDVFALMKLQHLVNKMTMCCSIRLLRMGTACLPGSQSVWQIRWEVIVFANETEN